MDVADLTKRRFSRSKAEYLIGAAQAVASGTLPAALAERSAVAAEQELTRIRGIGTWTARYVLMRGAGCTFNDIVDRDIDDKVARTRLRPIPSGQVSTRQAAAFLVAQALLGLLILIRFNGLTIGLGIGSLLLVAIYPFMKRITWWPQLFLGLAFSWGALLGWTSQTGNLGPAPLLLYLGCIAWVIGYDTIYALQDVEDDALIGVKSTARLFGDRVRMMVGVFYTAAVLLWLAAGLLAGGGLLYAIGLGCVAVLLAWQVVTLDASTPGNALERFRANQWAGVALTLALLAEWRW